MTTAPFPPTTTYPAQRVDVLLVTVTDAETQALPVAPSKLRSSALPPNPRLLKEIHTLIGYGLLEPLENGRYWLHALLVSHAKLLLDNT